MGHRLCLFHSLALSLPRLLGPQDVHFPAIFTPGWFPFARFPWKLYSIISPFPQSSSDVGFPSLLIPFLGLTADVLLWPLARSLLLGCYLISSLGSHFNCSFRTSWHFVGWKVHSKTDWLVVFCSFKNYYHLWIVAVMWLKNSLVCVSTCEIQ